jgi:release factor glutamine methyltransferase
VTSAAALLADSGLARTEARRLLAAALGAPIETLIARPEQAVDDTAATRFAALCARRARGEPIAYLLGEKEFYGRSFTVSPSVLVPRPETELLVQLVLQRLQDLRAPRVLDLGTGSGCIAITLALECANAHIVAVDRSAAALAIASGNAQRLTAGIEMLRSDWFECVTGRFDVIVANPPYVAAADPHLAALAHEPRDALAAGVDGLDDLRRIVAGAPAHLVPGGWLAVEHGFDQAANVRELFASAGFAGIETHRDLAGVERACTGTRASPV